MKISVRERVSYGAGGFGIQILTNTISTYFMLFLTNVMGIEALSAGKLFFHIKLIDGFTDLICASVVDTVRTKRGTYRPFLMIFSLPAAIFFILNFWAPDFIPASSRLLWAYLIYFFTSTVFATLNNIPYTALNSVMSHDRNDQSAFASARTIGENIASIIISYIAYKIVLSSGSVNSPSGWRIMAVCFGITGFAALQFCAYGVRERYSVTRGCESQYPVGQRLRALTKNTPLFGIMGIVVFFVLTNNYFETYFNYYCIYYLGHPEWTAGLATAGTLLTMAVAASVPKLVKYFEKRQLISFGVLCASSSYLFFYFARSYAVILLGQLLRGFGAAFIMTNIWGLLPECAVYGKWKTGITSPALIASIMLFSLKLSQALANYFVGFTLNFVAFDASLAEQSAATLSGIRTCVAIGPAFFSLIVILFTLLLKKIDRKNIDMIRETLKEDPDQC